MSLGQILSTVKEIKAADMVNKAQLSEAAAYLRKAQRYHNGSVYSSVQNSLLPHACDLLNPPMSKEELKNEKLAVKISQWIYGLILKQFNKSDFTPPGKKTTPGIIERALNLWWVFSGKEEKKNIKDKISAEGTSIRETAKSHYVDFKNEGYNDIQKYTYLLNDTRK